MLGKIIRYEMKAYGRLLLPIYIALVAMAIIMGVWIRVMVGGSNVNILFVFACLLYGLLFLAVVIVTTITAIKRYYGNMLGREGYLTFSLPTKTGTLMAGKTISAFIWTVFGFFAGAVAATITSLIAIKGLNLTDLWQGIGQILEELGKNPGLVFLWMLIFIFSTVVLIVRVYAAVSIGSQWSGKRLLGSVLVYVGFKMVETIIASVLNGITALNDWMLDQFVVLPGQVSTLGTYPFLFVMLGVLILEMAIYWLICWYFTDRKLNLE